MDGAEEDIRRTLSCQEHRWTNRRDEDLLEGAGLSLPRQSHRHRDAGGVRLVASGSTPSMTLLRPAGHAEPHEAIVPAREGR